MKIVSLAFIVFLASSQAVAQSDNESKGFISRVDVVAGAGISFLRGGDPVGTNQFQTRHLKFSYTLGVEFDHQIDESKSVSALLMYERKGVVYTQDGLFFNETTQSYEIRTARHEHNFDNYTLPLIANFKFGKESKLVLSGGPFLSYLSKQIVQTRSRNGTRGMTDETEFNRNFEGGLFVRCGYRIDLNEHLTLTPSLSNLCGLTSIRHPITYPTRSNVTYLQLELTIKQS